MLDGVLLLWYILVAGSLTFVIWDSITNTPVSWVQKLAWILVVFYTGPVGLFMYFLTCRNPGPGLHDQFTAAHWKQAFNSEMHCLAGDATGIVLAAIAVSFFALANGDDIVIEYVSAFLFGWLIFQALMMKSMYTDNYALAVRKTFFAETVSMNMVMVGMIPAMVLLKHALPLGRDPLHPHFWFIMGMATLAGGLTAYPINSWLVRSKLKHGCMTLPEKAKGSAKNNDHPAMVHGMPPTMGAIEHGHHEMGVLPLWQAGMFIAATFAILFAVAWLTSVLGAPITFSLGF